MLSSSGTFVGPSKVRTTSLWPGFTMNFVPMPQYPMVTFQTQERNEEKNKSAREIIGGGGVHDERIRWDWEGWTW